ncbi:MAG: CDP-alcohol phosphatidyltransferase family protein [Sphingomonas paucimobilis]
MHDLLLVFSSAATAEYRVAGVPAAARAIQAIGTLPQRAGIGRCTIVAGPGGVPDGALIDECRRLAPHVAVDFATGPAIAPNATAIRGERFVAALSPVRAGRPVAPLAALIESRMADTARPNDRIGDEASLLRMLDRAGRDILAASGKAGDGIVSRHLNRPISRSISRRLLRVPGITPTHASMGTAVLGFLMTLALFLGDEAGLIAGAILFQAASIFDGVDGEMARATWRSTDAGATLDSVIDACTNLAFLIGISLNVGLTGDQVGAAAGVVTLATLGSGLYLIGRRARSRGEPVNFDGIKHRLRARGRPSFLVEALIRLTMRDFLALATAMLVIAGLTHWLLLGSSIVALGWFGVTVVTLLRDPVEHATGGPRPATGR